MFIDLQYNSWYTELRDNFSPDLVKKIHDNVCFLNQVKGKIPRCGTIDPK